MKLISKNDLFDNALRMFDDSIFETNNLMKSDIYEKDNNYVIEIDVPGLDKDNIKIDYDDGYLTISATKENTLEENSNYIRKERYYGEYKRSFYIGNIDESNIKANYNNGTLNITFPKEEISKDTKKQIPID